MTGRRNLEQLRAAHARQAVEARRSLAEKEQKLYVSYLNALPATIVMNGLGQAAAMLLARAQGNRHDPHRLVYDDLQNWLCGKQDLAWIGLRGDLIRAIMEGAEDTYVLAQAEALAYCTWLKRFATAYLKSPELPGEVDR